ncbi:hypothetical protein SPPR111872_14970 [Sphingobacterium prati]
MNNSYFGYSEENNLKIKSYVRFVSLSNNVKKLKIIISGLNNTKVKSLKIHL